MRNTRRILAVLLAAALLAGLFAACGGGEAGSSAPASSQAPASSSQVSSSGASQAEKPAAGITFPLAERTKLTYWTSMSTQVSRTASNFAEIELYKTLSEKTNIEFEFIHPAIGEEATALNLLIASADMPDIIEYDYVKYPGRQIGALNDGVLMRLNDLIEAHMPNYRSMIEEYPAINAKTRNEKGEYAYIAGLYPSDQPLINWGGVVRTDLLEKVGMEAPTTVNEMYEVLKAFKDAGVSVPMHLGNTERDRSLKWNDGLNPFMGAWGIGYKHYADNGTVKFGPAQPEYKEFLTTVKQWYDEGLINPEFPTVAEQADLEAGAFSGNWGMWYYNVGPIEKATSEGRKKVPEYTLGGMQPIVMEKGRQNRFATFQFPVRDSGISIPAGSKNAGLVAAFADLGYDGGEISMLYSLGLEGVSYDLTGDSAVIRDEIVNNSAGVAMTDFLYRYCRGMNMGPFQIDARFYGAYWGMPEQIDAQTKWSIMTEATKANDPYVYGTLTGEESDQIGNALVQLETYVDEMYIKFVTGKESLDNFDKYLAELQTLKVDEITAVQQAKNDRYVESMK